jgi:hypothetical protein
MCVWVGGGEIALTEKQKTVSARNRFQPTLAEEYEGDAVSVRQEIGNLLNKKQK